MPLFVKVYINGNHNVYSASGGLNPHFIAAASSSVPGLPSLPFRVVHRQPFDDLIYWRSFMVFHGRSTPLRQI